MFPPSSLELVQTVLFEQKTCSFSKSSCAENYFILFQELVECVTHCNTFLHFRWPVCNANKEDTEGAVNMKSWGVPSSLINVRHLCLFSLLQQ